MTPELQQADLDPTTFEQLFIDLATHADVLGISAKGGATRYAGTDSLDLAMARAALLAGAVRGVQIRYRYQDSEWWDTILALNGVFRLVRTRPDFTEASS